MKTYILIVVLFISAIVYAQSDVTIKGRVLDRETGQGLPGTNILLEGTFLGGLSDVDGRFQIVHVPEGRYVIRASYIGYASKSVPLLVERSKANVVEILLEPSAIQLNQVVITGSRQPETLAKAAASINVLGKEDIQRRNLFRLDEALQNVPGLAIVGESVNIRGGAGYNRLGGSRSLVLLDEVPILTSDLGAANWNILPITEIEHIEVLKGAASSLYGSGALSGVVNVLTKQPSRNWSAAIRQSGGLYDEPSVAAWKWTDKPLYFYRTDASLSRSYGSIGVRLAVSHHRSTGDRENGYFSRWYGTAKVTGSLPAKTTFTLFTTYSHEDRELFLQWLEQNRALNVPTTERGNGFAMNGIISYAVLQKMFTPTLSGKLRASYNQQLVGVPFNIANAFTPALGLSAEWQMNWKPHAAHSVSFGVDYKHDLVESLYYGKRSAHGVSPYIQEIWKLSELVQVNAGVRYDTYTLVGDSLETQWSPKIGASYQPVFGTILHGSFGRGFRAATVVERFISAGSKDFRALPNPDLQPERSTLADLGVRQQIGRMLYLEVTAFYNRYNNLIEPTLASDLTAQFLNYPQARVQGIETEARLSLWQDRLVLQTAGTWMDPVELASKEPLLYRPRFVGHISPSLQLRRWNVAVDYRYVSRLQRVAVYPLDERVPSHVWDVHVQYAWPQVNVQFDIRNALNYNYTVSERVLGEIRNYVLTVSHGL
jgi:outer membrane receptor protein involved in Fe transport